MRFLPSVMRIPFYRKAPLSCWLPTGVVLASIGAQLETWFQPLPRSAETLVAYLPLNPLLVDP